MLTISSEFVDAVNGATQASDLHAVLQGAIELEHATIPAYLQALYSIVPGSNILVARLIRSVIIEEMLHMTIAANLLNALGGRPAIDTPGFIPTYPGHLPMNVHGSLTVGLAPLSKDLLEHVFMEIEMPDQPHLYQVKLLALQPLAATTIGQFYSAIVRKLQTLGDGIFTGDPARQVVDNTWFPPGQLFAIRDVASAVQGINIILQQGEGSTQHPIQADGQPAHYFRFAEILYGRYLLPDDTASNGYSYSGAPIPFDPQGIRDMTLNPTLQGYAAGSPARAGAERFNRIYTHLLSALHTTFNGRPQNLSQAIGIMYELRLAAQALIDLRDRATGKLAAPTFEYLSEDA